MFCDNGVIVGSCQEDAEDVILHDGGVLDSAHVRLWGAVEGGYGGEGGGECLAHGVVGAKLLGFNSDGD